jgi:flagellar biosynthesis protein FlhF
MKIQRFEGDNAREALLKAQQALGQDVVILQTRTVRAPGILRRSRVEVLAAVDASMPSMPAAMAGVGSGAVAASRLATATMTAPPPMMAPPSAPSTPSVPPAWLAEVSLLRQEMESLRLQMARNTAVTRSADAPEAAVSTGQLIERLRSELTTRSVQLKPGVCTAIGLVGPTGVGKTTTLAKLAAAAARGERKRVAFVTVDSYRVGAIEQLETYARLLEAPISRIYAPEELRAARARYADYDLVLVDTTGRSSNNEAQIAEQAALLEGAHLDEVHLCLDSGASRATLEQVLCGFARMKPTQVLLTKLDETSSLSTALSVVLDSGLPLSYLSIGQRVPEDLALADGEQLSHWITEGLPWS